MPEYTPLTREERACLVDAARKAVGQFPAPFAPETVLLYEATVKDRDERNAALEAELDGCRKGSAMWEDSARYESAMRAKAEAEVKRLTPLAEVGEAVEAFPRGWSIGHSYDGETYEVWNDRSKRLSKKPTAHAAMRAAKGKE